MTTRPRFTGPSDADIATMYERPYERRAIVFTRDGAAVVIDPAAYSPQEKRRIVPIVTVNNCTLLRRRPPGTAAKGAKRGTAGLARDIRNRLHEYVVLAALHPHRPVHDLNYSDGCEGPITDAAEFRLSREKAGHDPDVVLSIAARERLLNPRRAVESLDYSDDPTVIELRTSASDAGDEALILATRWLEERRAERDDRDDGFGGDGGPDPDLDDHADAGDEAPRRGPGTITLTAAALEVLAAMNNPTYKRTAGAGHEGPAFTTRGNT